MVIDPLSFRLKLKSIIESFEIEDFRRRDLVGPIDSDPSRHNVSGCLLLELIDYFLQRMLVEEVLPWLQKDRH